MVASSSCFPYEPLPKSIAHQCDQHGGVFCLDGASSRCPACLPFLSAGLRERCVGLWHRTWFAQIGPFHRPERIAGISRLR